MMRGFALGTLVLVGLYALVQNGTGDKAQQASNVLVAGMKRLLDPNVAGLANHAKTSGGQTPSSVKKPTGPTIKNT